MNDPPVPPGPGDELQRFHPDLVRHHPAPEVILLDDIDREDEADMDTPGSTSPSSSSLYAAVVPTAEEPASAALPPPPAPHPPSDPAEERGRLLAQLQGMISSGSAVVLNASADQTTFTFDGVKKYGGREWKHDAVVRDPKMKRKCTVAIYDFEDAVLAARAVDKMKIKMYLCGAGYSGRNPNRRAKLNFPPEHYLDDMLEVGAVHDYQQYRTSWCC